MGDMEVDNSTAQNDVLFEAHENAPFGIETAVEAAPVPLSPVQIQQEYFENLPDCDWVKYELHNRNYLLQNMAFALFGSPSSEGELSEVRNESDVHLEGYTHRQKEQVMRVYEKVCEQSKYTQNDEDVMISVLLIVCARPKPVKFYQITPSNHWLDLHQKTDSEIWCTAVFRVRKCIPQTVGAKSCKVFIDEDARVYQDWESYLLNNTQPKCVLIVPENGEYDGTITEGGDRTFAVKLTVAPSPTLGIKAQVLSTVDTASTVASIGAIGVLGVAVFTPVAPVVLAGAAVATVSTCFYGLVRSSLHLHDRSSHEQSISPTDAEARGSWLNIAASSVGLAAGAASNLLARSAAAGTNMTKTGQALAVSVEVLRHANLVTGGAGVVNSLVHIILKYRHGEQPTKLELFQFTAATLFFCHAVMSNKTAQSIIEDAQAKAINEYRSTLRSNRHRKIFDKLSAESRRVAGTIQGNTEVIRGIQSIGDKDQYFASVLKINKDINTHRLRISMTADGQVNLNAQHKFNPADLSMLDPNGRSQLFNSLGPDTLPAQNVPTKLSTAITPSRYIDNQEEENNNLLVGIHPGEVLRIGTYLVRISASGTQNIAKLLEDLSQEIYANLMTVVFNILSNLLPNDIARLRLLSPDEDLVMQIVNFVFNYMKHKRPLGDPCVENDNGIIYVLKEFFQEGRVRQDIILLLKDRLMMWVEEEIDARAQRFPNKKQIICDLCQGIRFA
ncbi:uncharacterized protein LOC134650992 [Cydia amplana]|uniref:uncharacterized protein LOC134650992 n=1 Tax=Cydia amplana TaxID=1869771 RepID=UPI002FE65248